VERRPGKPPRGGEPPVATPAEPAPIEPRQRWRIVFARDAAVADRTHREVADAWTAAIERAGLPLPRGVGRPRPPLTFAAPLPVGVGAERELTDLVLAQRLPIRDVRSALVAAAPDGITIVDLHDVWLGAPALSASVEAADYRIELGPPVPAGEDVEAAAAQLLAAPTLERERPRGSGSVRYDLRPLLGDVRRGATDAELLVRTLFHVERGAGRPEEVLAALGERLGRTLAADRTTRLRLLLRGEGSTGDRLR
jgi:radical SAM-linked protein